MTEQYQQRNINNPSPARVAASAAAAPNVDFRTDDSMLLVDSSLAGGGMQVDLPRAAEMPGAIITIVAVTGATQTVSPAPADGDTVVVPSSLIGGLPLSTDQATMMLQSDGVSSWRVLTNAP